MVATKQNMNDETDSISTRSSISSSRNSMVAESAFLRRDGTLNRLRSRDGSNRDDNTNRFNLKRLPSVIEAIEKEQGSRDDSEMSLPSLDGIDDSSTAAVPPIDSFASLEGKIRRHQFEIFTKLFVYFVILCVTYSGLSLSLHKGYNKVVTVSEQADYVKLNDMMGQFSSLFSLNQTAVNQRASDKQRPGLRMANKGAEMKYPVVMIPGFITSGLEMWKGNECAEKYFRQRMWGAVGGARTLLTDRDCWLQHLSLNTHTGMDPEGIRIRAAESFQAADYFMATYWVWDKLITNLADIGYDAGSMSMEAYDWRLSFPKLEERDGYLTKLRYKIEAFHTSTGEKVVLTSHSMGTQLVHYFFSWVTTDKAHGGGGGGENWVDEHIHSYINIAGTHLGVPKAASALLSGEMKDTVVLGPVGAMVEHVFGRLLRKDLFTTWGSIWGMLPKGGDEIWGLGVDVINDAETENDDEVFPLFTINSNDNRNTDSDTDELCECEEDDDICETRCLEEAETTTTSNTVAPKKLQKLVDQFASRSRHSTNEAIDFLKEWGGSLGSSISASQLYAKDKRMQWLDLTKTPLPHAPNMKMYCMYGVGADTERAYYYKHSKASKASWAEQNNKSNTDKDKHYNVNLPLVMDTGYNDPKKNVRTGIQFSDGDGSVPLLSLGYMCVDAWKNSREDTGLNPSNVDVITREYKHQPRMTVEDPMRGGPKSADHVDILGNVDMMEDFLRIVSDYNPLKESHIESKIEEIAQQIPLVGRAEQNDDLFFEGFEAKTIVITIICVLASILSSFVGYSICSNTVFKWLSAKFRRNVNLHYVELSSVSKKSST